MKSRLRKLEMKHLFILLFISGQLFGQINKLVYGNFVIGNKVFQYKCERDNSIYKFSISTMEPKTIFSETKVEDIDEILGFIDNRINEDITKNQEIFYTNLKNNYLEIKTIIENRTSWTSSEKTIGSMLTEGRKEFTKDTLKILKLLEDYQTFLNRNKDYNQSKVKTTEGFDIKVFGSLFKESLSEIVQDKSLLGEFTESVTNEVFYAIKTKLEFVEDEPTTAYLILKRKYLDIVFRYNSSNELTDKQKEKVKKHLIDSITIDETRKYNLKLIEEKDFIESSIPTYRNLKKKRRKVVVDSLQESGLISLTGVKKKGFLKIEVEIKVNELLNSYVKNKTELKEVVKCEIKKVSVEFDEGTIKNILIDVLPIHEEYNRLYGESTIRFRNNMPISISSKFDPDKFKNHKIFVSNSKELLDELNAKRLILKIDCIDCENSIRLSNLLDLNIVLENDKEDYSPANCIVNLSETNSIVQLKKEKRSKILTVIGYSDLAGLNNENPNGLVQFEVSRRMNINTHKIPGFFKGAINKGASYTGYLNYIKPKLAYNKIEENNKYLILNSQSIDTTRSFKENSNNFFVNPLHILLYRIYTLQVDLNLFNWNLPNKKTNFHLNTYINGVSTFLADSLKIQNRSVLQTPTRNTNTVGSFMYGLDLFAEIKPDGRYGVSFGCNYGYLNILDDAYLKDEKFKNAIVKLYATGFMKTGDESKVFFRYSMNYTNARRNNNFAQIQLGYVIDLFGISK
jgi:hypothetical protein